MKSLHVLFSLCLDQVFALPFFAVPTSTLLHHSGTMAWGCFRALQDGSRCFLQCSRCAPALQVLRALLADRGRAHTRGRRSARGSRGDLAAGTSLLLCLRWCRWRVPPLSRSTDVCASLGAITHRKANRITCTWLGFPRRSGTWKASVFGARSSGRSRVAEDA